MKIDILICTIDDGIQNIHQLLEPFHEDVEYKISHQYRDEKYLMIPDNLKRKEVMISQISGKGLSRNRNNALKMANADIAVIADDDVRYLPESFKIIAGVFEKDPLLDVACFKIKTLEGEPEFKDYPKEECVLKKHRHHYISSIEIAFRVESVKAKNILFDERFGLGSEKIPDAEEIVFIKDCIKSGIKVKFFPEYIVQHPFENSGRGTPYSSTRNRVKGAYHARVLGWKAVPVAVAETFVRLPVLLINKRNPFVYLYERLNSIRYIFVTEKTR
jgi:glycosyltransferase involved in cell wall biosynthesis